MKRVKTFYVYQSILVQVDLTETNIDIACTMSLEMQKLELC